MGLFKTKPQFESSNSMNSDKRVQVDLELMGKNCNLNIEVLSSNDNAVIRKLNNDYYKELSAELGNLHTQFQYFIIWEVNKLLPPDLLFSAHFNHKNEQPHSQETFQYYLREELFDYYLDDPEQNIKEIMCMLKKSPKMS
jgi:hypothetical protein